MQNWFYWSPIGCHYVGAGAGEKRNCLVSTSKLSKLLVTSAPSRNIYICSGELSRLDLVRSNIIYFLTARIAQRITV